MIYRDRLQVLIVDSKGSKRISLFTFPRMLYKHQLAPAIIGKSIDQYFPGFNYISKELYFITYINGYIGIKGQKIFRQIKKQDLEKLDDRKLRQSIVQFKLSVSGGTELNKTQMIDKLEDYYASNNWNPLYISDEELYKLIIYCLLVTFLYILQFLNYVLYMLWPAIMFLRLPIVLFLMIFHSSTKLIFFKRSWNKIIYLWTLDENKLKSVDDRQIDLELLHMVKQQEVVLEVGLQFTLQLVNAIMREKITDVYIVSVAGSPLTWHHVYTVTESFILETWI